MACALVMGSTHISAATVIARASQLHIQRTDVTPNPEKGNRIPIVIRDKGEGLAYTGDRTQLLPKETMSVDENNKCSLSFDGKKL